MAETRVHEAAAPPADRGTELPEGGHGSDSLFKNAYFLMLSTGVSAVLGLGFWLVAARYYSEEAVGQGSAAIAAMRLLASITATTMIGAVVRFVPRAGRATGTLVWRAYAASSVVVAVAAVVFLLTLDLWGPSYAPLGTAATGVLFVLACVAWALLTLQDGVLTGLRRAEWVPAGNAVFSVGKLILLALFATSLPVLGIFVSWAVAIAFSTLPLGWLIFRRLIPRQAEADRDVEPPKAREMGRFLAGDSLGALFSLAMINLLPVMVAVNFSAAQNGYFYVAYTVGGTMEFMAINMASSLTAHASHDPRRLADGIRGALRRMTVLLVPVVLFLVVFAPQILAPFDEDYAEHGSTVLRLLAVGALPRIVVELYIGVLRVQGRTGVLAAVQGTMCVLVLGSAAVLFTPAGISGAGWAVLGSMTVVALGCAPGLRSALRGIEGAGRPEAPAAAEDAGPGLRPKPRPGTSQGTGPVRLNATAGYANAGYGPAEYGTSWARRAAHEHGRSGDASGEDTVALFIGRPGFEREALEADTLAVIRRPRRRGPATDDDAHAGIDADTRGARRTGRGPVGRDPAGTDPAGRGPADSDPAGTDPAGSDPASTDRVGREPAVTGPAATGPAGSDPAGTDPASTVPAGSEPAGADPASTDPVGRESAVTDPAATGPAGSDPASAHPPEYGTPPSASGPAPEAVPSARYDDAPGPIPERFLRPALWLLAAGATAVFWAAVRQLPWLEGPSASAAGLTGRELLRGLPVSALVAGGVLLVVFVAAATLSVRLDPWLPGAALGSALLALYAAPVALGREPEAVGGALYVRAARFLAEALGLDGPGPVLRWAPLVLLPLCLVPLWTLLGKADGRLPWPGRWGLLYFAAVAGWVWRQELAPVTPPLLLLLGLAAVLLSLRRPDPAGAGSTTGPSTSGSTRPAQSTRPAPSTRPTSPTRTTSPTKPASPASLTRPASPTDTSQD
ncbi:lipopolysaccharide biosynthesis protein [Streptomyces sp. BPPL-273]|uniref:lipopolysaccharide biosynthesis protein n=1 Tax=Streptomyces sp. BPPL-273 TaxID=2987533 RepID=UPI0024AF3999|nr:lipopolysaccharide biosynthesis protein [Streptomyces sp. BPPL-273]WHM31399.1 lipopolysaccharide biosynthesis protein [Streptomyces sp. BPPL-273]